MESPYSKGFSNQAAGSMGFPSSGAMQGDQNGLPKQRQQPAFGGYQPPSGGGMAAGRQVAQGQTPGMQPVMGQGTAQGAQYQTKTQELPPQVASLLRSHQVMGGMLANRSQMPQQNRGVQPGAAPPLQNRTGMDGRAPASPYAPAPVEMQRAPAPPPPPIAPPQPQAQGPAQAQPASPYGPQQPGAGPQQAPGVPPPQPYTPPPAPMAPGPPEPGPSAPPSPDNPGEQPPAAEPPAPTPESAPASQGGGALGGGTVVDGVYVPEKGSPKPGENDGKGGIVPEYAPGMGPHYLDDTSTAYRHQSDAEMEALKKLYADGGAIDKGMVNALNKKFAQKQDQLQRMMAESGYGFGGAANPAQNQMFLDQSSELIDQKMELAKMQGDAKLKVAQHMAQFYGAEWAHKYEEKALRIKTISEVLKQAAAQNMIMGTDAFNQWVDAQLDAAGIPPDDLIRRQMTGKGKGGSTTNFTGKAIDNAPIIEE